MIRLYVRSYISYDTKEEVRPETKDVPIISNLVQALKYAALMAKMPKKSVQCRPDTLEGNCEDLNYPYTHIWDITIKGLILFPEDLHYFMSVVDSLFNLVRQEVGISAYVAPLDIHTIYDVDYE